MFSTFKYQELGESSAVAHSSKPATGDKVTKPGLTKPLE
jgi:hypothetical protein